MLGKDLRVAYTLQYSDSHGEVRRQRALHCKV